MSYELSFSPEFFYGENDDDVTDKPTSVRAAVFQLARDEKRWAAMCDECFPGIKAECIDVDIVMDKIRETNACRDLRTPVEVYIDDAGWHSVKVY